MRLEQTIPALPVCDAAESFLAGTASSRISVDDVDGLYAEYSGTAVLHRVSSR